MSVLDTKPGLRELTEEMFQSAVGQTFKFKRPAGQQTTSDEYVELKLIQVKGFANRVPPIMEPEQRASVAFRIPFSLLFELEDGTPLGAGLHRIEHLDFLPEDWHIARVHVTGRDPKKAYYEAVFG